MGWRSDFTTFNRFGKFSTGLRVVNIDADFETRLFTWTKNKKKKKKEEGEEEYTEVDLFGVILVPLVAGFVLYFGYSLLGMSRKPPREKEKPKKGE